MIILKMTFLKRFGDLSVLNILFDRFLFNSNTIIMRSTCVSDLFFTINKQLSVVLNRLKSSKI